MVCLVLTLAWGATAFGGIYPWAYAPLLAASAALGAVGLMLGRSSLRWPVVASLSLAAAAVCVQLLPISVETLRGIAPRSYELQRQHDLAAAVGEAKSWTLSIDAAQTQLGLLFVATFVLLLLGATRMLTRVSARRLAVGLSILGVALALAGLLQRATFNGKLYGMWVLTQGGSPFGPFVNRNHFAGWMLMVLPITIGLFASIVNRGTGIGTSFRSRVLWFATAEANTAILTGFAVLTMALALVLTLSRSGITALAGAMVFASLMMAMRQTSGNRLLVPAYLAVVGIIIVSWVDTDRIATRFAAKALIDSEGRRAIWADAWRIVEDFWLTGTGLNTFGVSALFYQGALQGSHMREAHNDYLQLLAEGGLLLAIPTLIAVVAIGFSIRRRLLDDVGSIWWIRMGAVTGLLAIGAQSLVEFSLQMPANAALFSVICAIALHDGGRAVRRTTAPIPEMAEETRTAQVAPGKVVRFGNFERLLDVAFDDAPRVPRQLTSDFDPSQLDDSTPLPASRDRTVLRSAQHPPVDRASSHEGRTIALVAALSFVAFLLLISGMFTGCANTRPGNRPTTTGAATMTGWKP